MKTKELNDRRNLFIGSLNTVPACQTQDGDTDWFPAVDVTETGREYVFDVDLPGLKPEEIELRVDSAGLSISGQRRPRHQGGQLVRLERPSGAFVRKLALPPDAEGEIRATFGDGVLELHVPRARADDNSENAALEGHSFKESRMNSRTFENPQVVSGRAFRGQVPVNR